MKSSSSAPCPASSPSSSLRIAATCAASRSGGQLDMPASAATMSFRRRVLRPRRAAARAGRPHPHHGAPHRQEPRRDCPAQAGQRRLHCRSARRHARHQARRCAECTIAGIELEKMMEDGCERPSYAAIVGSGSKRDRCLHYGANSRTMEKGRCRRHRRGRRVQHVRLRHHAHHARRRPLHGASERNLRRRAWRAARRRRSLRRWHLAHGLTRRSHRSHRHRFARQGRL